ncbi:MAG TPA: ABC transporter permease [Vicinamibacterales bacterium]|nr:ABC transporter permease [Vicinamibacterales bacterium]
MSRFTSSFALFVETAVLALDTLRTNKLRSGLTVLGIVIGITSIVGMTSLIRGFDQSMQATMRQLGPNTIFIAKFSAISLTSGASFVEMARRPNITVEDAEAIKRLAPSAGLVDIWLGAGGQPTMERVFYRGDRTTAVSVLGTTDRFAEINFATLVTGRVFTDAEVQRRKALAVLGYGPYESLFEQKGIDPIGKKVRIGAVAYTVIGVMGKRPGIGGFNTGQDNFAIVPYTTYRKQFGSEVRRTGGPFAGPAAMIAVVPREGATRDDLLYEVEEIMRIRHDLTLDKPNDFDVITQDAALALWERISQAILLSLVVISSIALMVGGIGVMSIMTISVTERTREIGVRKAIGARKREILWQFLIEAVVLTCVGGVIGIAMGSLIGLVVSFASGFPVALPLSSFALGLGFSASIGIFFGIVPAWRAARLDPIEALRYE